MQFQRFGWLSNHVISAIIPCSPYMVNVRVSWKLAQFLVAYHLHGQTGRSTVQANGAQNSGLVNFVQESRLPFVRIISIYWKTTANTNYRLEYSVWKNSTTFSPVPQVPEIFRWNDQKSHVPLQIDGQIDSLIELNYHKVYKCNNL